MPIFALIVCFIGFILLLIVTFRLYCLQPDVEDELNFKPLIVRGAYGSYSTYINDTNKRMHSGDETGYSNRWRGIGCLASIFLTEQMLFQFYIIDFLKLILVMMLG